MFWGLCEAGFLPQPPNLSPRPRNMGRGLGRLWGGDSLAAAAGTREVGQWTTRDMTNHLHASPHVAALGTPSHGSQDQPPSSWASAEGRTPGANGPRTSSPLA